MRQEEAIASSWFSPKIDFSEEKCHGKCLKEHFWASIFQNIAKQTPPQAPSGSHLRRSKLASSCYEVWLRSWFHNKALSVRGRGFHAHLITNYVNISQKISPWDRLYPTSPCLRFDNHHTGKISSIEFNHKRVSRISYPLGPSSFFFLKKNRTSGIRPANCVTIPAIKNAQV